MAEYMFHILKMNFIAAAMIFAALVLARITKRKYSSKWKYYMWLVVMLFLMIPVDFSAKSPVKIQINPVKTTEIQEHSLDNETADIEREEMKLPVLSAERTDSVLKISSAKFSLYTMLQIFAGIWIVGIVFFGGLRGLRYYFSLHGMMRWSYPTNDTKYLGKYFEVCKRKKIRKPPRLLICEGLPSPMLAGIRFPGVYIPEEDYGEKELEFIFLHELSHYRRHDLWYKMFMLVVTTVYWFNPALYFMQKEAEKDIENLCDGKMVAHYTMKERMKYGELLLKFAASQSSIPYVSVSFNDSKRVFRDRILYMKNLKFLKERFFPAVVLSAVMVVAHLLVGSSIGGFPVKAEELVDFMPVERTAEIEEIVEPVAENFGSGDEKDNFVEMDTTVPKRIETVENNVEEDDGISEEPFPLEPEETPVPIPTEEAEIEFTGEHQKVLYVYGNGSADIYKATDGNWYDDFGRCYIFQGDGYWIHAETGAIWADLETLSIPPEQNATSEVAVTDQEAISFGTLYLGPDGVWRNEAGGIYTNNGDNTFRDVDGEVWYTVSEE